MSDVLLAYQGLILLHQGEELVPLLPVILLVSAYFLISWAGKQKPVEPSEEPDPEPGTPAD